MASRVGVLGPEGGAEGVHVGERLGEALDLELAGHGQVGGLAEEVLVLVAHGDVEQLTGALGVGCGDDRRVHPHEAAVREELLGSASPRRCGRGTPPGRCWSGSAGAAGCAGAPARCASSGWGTARDRIGPMISMSLGSAFDLPRLLATRALDHTPRTSTAVHLQAGLEGVVGRGAEHDLHSLGVDPSNRCTKLTFLENRLVLISPVTSTSAPAAEFHVEEGGNGGAALVGSAWHGCLRAQRYRE